ncbi:4-(cytidine 5'-diphospho)-2-C-methyl-D-erythritol kinase [Desulfobulbus propionicus]
MEQETLVLKAPAKINLSLWILGRREDGYHLLATRMQKVGLYDELTLAPATAGIHLQCSNADLPTNAANLVYRAAKLFFENNRDRLGQDRQGVRLFLRKKIPVAAGLGGGSSDAAATLLGLNRLFRTGCSPDTLAVLGLKLGADVPFFLNRSPAVMATGIGEVLHPVAPLADCRILLVNPGFSVSTRWVYQTFALTEKISSGNLKNSQEDVVRSDVPELPESLVNDLERVTLKEFPDLGRLKAEMLAQGAEMSMMSGSGPTVFGIFRDQQKALAAKVHFHRRHVHTFLVDPLTEK